MIITKQKLIGFGFPPEEVEWFEREFGEEADFDEMERRRREDWKQRMIARGFSSKDTEALLKKVEVMVSNAARRIWEKEDKQNENN